MSRLEIEFSPAASEEAVAAYLWYANRSSKAANGFLNELDAVIARIQSSPQSGGHYLHGTQCHLLRRYPYLVVYRTTERAIQVVAVAHGRRRPGYWKSRKR
jgi:plasmid stabilization system protein ParE